MTEWFGSSGPDTPKFIYSSLTEFSGKDILPNCGFGRASVARMEKEESFLRESIMNAIKHPDWLAIGTDTPEYIRRIDLDLPRPQFIQSDDWEKLSAITSLDDNTFRQLKSFEYQDLHSPALEDLGIRVFEVMAEKYPNLAMFRGGEFDRERGYQGADFAPGDLADVLENFALRSYGGRRQ